MNRPTSPRHDLFYRAFLAGSRAYKDKPLPLPKYVPSWSKWVQGKRELPWILLWMGLAALTAALMCKAI